MARTFFITTAIDYTNSAPHLGHAYEKVLADVIARHHRRGHKETVFFMTGVDQHGQKVQQSAAKMGIAPEEFVAGVTDQFVTLWDKLDVHYDVWAATTDPLHKRCVQGILQRLYDEGKIYKDRQIGFYSVRQEQFLTDKDRNEAGEFGQEWGEVEKREEENYYFQLAREKQWLLDLIDKRSRAGTPFVVPDFRTAELRNAVEKLGGDLCVSRPKSRLSWGIELPFDAEYVNYVWFDALTNYISFAGYDPSKSFENQSAEFRARWPALHVIGKDILVPAHGIYWPIMLHALGFPDEQMPTLLVHGWWNISGAKMSKSLGNVVDPYELVRKYGAEALRYYLMRGIATGADADFSEERLVEFFNNRLANNIGNLLNRTLNMLHRFCGGVLPIGYAEARKRQPGVLPFLEPDNDGPGSELRYKRWMDRNDPANALEEIELAATSCNELIEHRKPWALAADETRREELEAILVLLAQAIRVIAVRLGPVLPEASAAMVSQISPDPKIADEAAFINEGGRALQPNQLVAKPKPLFPRIEG